MIDIGHLFKRRSLLALAFVTLALINKPARATEYVSEGIVTPASQCESGFRLVSEEVHVYNRCIRATKKINLESLVGQKIKVRWGYGRYNEMSIKEYNPSDPVGTTKAGFADHIIGAAAVVSTTASAVQGNPVTPPQDQPTAPAQTVPMAVQASTGQASTASYATGVNGCISTFVDSSNYNFFSYQNGCGEKVNIFFLTRDGHGGSMDLDPGAHNATGDTPENLGKIGPYEFYACPYHFVAVDANGQRFTRPVTLFKCAKAY